MSTFSTEFSPVPTATLPGPPRPLRLFVFSHPRTASNLLCKLFSEHPQLKYHEYPFLFAYYCSPDAQAMQEKDPGMKDNFLPLRELLKHTTYQTILDKLEQDISEAEAENKSPKFKDHCGHLIQAPIVKGLLERPRGIPPKPKMEDKLLDVPEDSRGQLNSVPYYDLTSSPRNPTIFPDRLLKTLAPVFVIRHPAKQVGSFYKAYRVHPDNFNSSEFELGTSYKPSRLLFDYFKQLYRDEQGLNSSSQNESKWPIVVDGDDLINDTEGVALRFCASTGLDSTGVIYKWDKTDSDASNPFQVAFLGTLNASNGVLKNESPEIPSLVKEAEKWERDWGHEIAHKLVQYAEKAMDDYQYLYRHAL